MSALIRLAEPSDASDILAIYGPYCESTSVSFEIAAPSLDEMRERIAHVTGDYPWLVAEIDDKVVGYVYASRHHPRAAYRWSVDVAVYILPLQQRSGVGRILYETLFSILPEQGLFKAFAVITLPNPASIGLHESCGFRRVAILKGAGYKFGKWHDVGYWQLDLQPERDFPPDPKPFHIFRANPAVATALAKGNRKISTQWA